ncbi:hypothetical protein I4F81_008454 [Pyropia yezoensis]|uniref:Uncharacterized protein n=1 Tax=Pyropia yezoensis TaxID=2788 RepID=A0ACC3C801_PYRYE|nr:hypothetical protein I4F81_008454 [Neopyropia yezoensis]
MTTLETATVYPPSEDTYLLLDVLAADVPTLPLLATLPPCPPPRRRRRQQRRPPPPSPPPLHVLEIGCGSGVVITDLAARLTAATARPVVAAATDISGHAAAATRAASAGAVAVVRADLFGSCWREFSTPWRSPAAGGVGATTTDAVEGASPAVGREGRGGGGGGRWDVVVFNPPYVPTSAEELDAAVAGGGIEASWAGGADGRVVIDRFLAVVGDEVRDGGVVYLLLLAANRPEEVAAAASAVGFDAVTVGRRWGGAERLCVLRLTRRPRGGGVAVATAPVTAAGSASGATASAGATAAVGGRAGRGGGAGEGAVAPASFGKVL